MKSLRLVLVGLLSIITISFGDFKREIEANWNRHSLENAKAFYTRDNAKVYELAEEFYYYNLDMGVNNIENTYEELAIFAISFQKGLEAFCLDPEARYNKAYGDVDKDNLCKVVYKKYGLSENPSVVSDTYTWLEIFHKTDIWDQLEYSEVRNYIEYLKRVAPPYELKGTGGLVRYNKGE
jgi:hypothetical protein